MVHERDDRAREFRDDRRRHGAVGEPVDQKDGAGRQPVDEPKGLGKVALGRVGKACGQLQMADAEARPFELLDDLAGVGIAARRGGKVAGNAEDDLGHRRALSYHARATSDSCRVTRIRATPSDPGPSAP